MSMEAGRTAAFTRNESLEGLLGELEELLRPAEELALRRGPERGRPVVLVVGAPRSGTTLMVQWLAASGALAYPTNLLSRFYHAPAIGARIQQLLTDPRFAHRDELEGIAHPIGFESDLGKTRGPLAPNEFWYFWRRFLPSTDIEPLGERVRDADVVGLRSALNAMTDVFGRAMVMKGMMLQYDIAVMGEALPEVVFLHVERDACSNARSILNARRRFFGDEARWYSARPPGFEALLDLEPAEQAAGQVLLTNERIRSGLQQLPHERQLHVSYEAFCADPQGTWARVSERLGDQAGPLPARHPHSEPFRATEPPGAEDPVRGAVDRLSQELSR